MSPNLFIVTGKNYGYFLATTSETCADIKEKGLLPSYSLSWLISSRVLRYINWHEIELGFEFPYSSFLKAFKDMCSVTNIAKYRSFQYRLLHWAIVTNLRLQRWGMRSNDLCIFCGKSTGSYLHLFIYCVSSPYG